MERVRRVLVIAPHADDEVIGCGGTIARASSEGSEVHVVVMGMGGIRHRAASVPVSFEQRRAELDASSAVLGISKVTVLNPGHEMRLEEVPLVDLVTALDAVLDQGYDEIYLPRPDHNADHRRTFEAALAALRPGAGHQPALIAEYETAGHPIGPESSQDATLFVDISLHVGSKLQALRCYASQLREFPHPFSVDAVERTVLFHGAAAGRAACERFRILRMIR